MASSDRRSIASAWNCCSCRFPIRLRSFAKPLTEVLGQRGGQALASIFILSWLALGRGDDVLAVVSALLCVVWIAWTVNLKPHYLGDVSRRGTQPGRWTTRLTCRSSTWVPSKCCSPRSAARTTQR